MSIIPLKGLERQLVTREQDKICSIFINMVKFKGGDQVEKYFDAWVGGDCQQFASVMRETKDKLQGMGDSQEVVKEYALVHQDSRPLWRYY